MVAVDSGETNMGIWPAIQRFAERNSPTRETWASITARAFSSSCLDPVVLQLNQMQQLRLVRQ
jgi:hypothetical protein